MDKLQEEFNSTANIHNLIAKVNEIVEWVNRIEAEYDLPKCSDGKYLREER